MNDCKPIREVCPTPSAAIRAMCRGLRKYGNLKTFVVEMSFYGANLNEMTGGGDPNEILYLKEAYPGKQISKRTCFGCAATCAVQDLYGRLDPEHIDPMSHPEFFGLEHQEVWNFETAINDARMGNLTSLFQFYGLAVPNQFRKFNQPSDWNTNWSRHIGLWELSSANWEKRLPKYDRLADQLEKAGC